MYTANHLATRKAGQVLVLLLEVFADHENLHRPSSLNDYGSPVESKNNFFLPDNVTANRITTFHNFCKGIPNVVCHYCSITLYPEGIQVGSTREQQGQVRGS